MLKHKNLAAFSFKGLHFYTFRGLFLSSIYEASKKDIKEIGTGGVKV